MTMSETTSTELIVKTFPIGPLQCNCTIIGNPVTHRALLIDPGGDAEVILQMLKDLNLHVVQVLHTHAHLDHFLASGEIKKQTGAQLCLHKDDSFLWDMLETQCMMFGVPYSPAPAPDHWLEHEEELELEDLKGVCLHTPGHSPGSMCFHFDTEKLLIAGDTLFQGSIGRTDLWGGDYRAIEKSIKQRLYTLDEACRVITGHGPATSLGFEMRNNPFVKAI